MKTIKGPAIYLAQFMADEEPFNNIEAMAEWALATGCDECRFSGGFGADERHNRTAGRELLRLAGPQQFSQ